MLKSTSRLLVFYGKDFTINFLYYSHVSNKRYAIPMQDVVNRLKSFPALQRKWDADHRRRRIIDWGGPLTFHALLGCPYLAVCSFSLVLPVSHYQGTNIGWHLVLGVIKLKYSMPWTRAWETPLEFSGKRRLARRASFSRYLNVESLCFRNCSWIWYCVAIILILVLTKRMYKKIERQVNC